MEESRRTSLRWVGSLAGLALIAVGLRMVLIHGSVNCGRSGIGQGYVCAGHAPTHPHAVLGFVVAAAGLAILVGSRRYFSSFGRSA